MFARMGNVKIGRLVDPETEEDLSQVETVLSTYGIKLRDSVGEFRNFGDVLDEVSSKWSSYGSVAQHAIATAFSGTRQQEKFMVLMSGYDDALKYMEVAANSAGTAVEKYGAYSDGIESHTKKFQASFEAFSQSVMNSDLVSGTFDAGSGILGFLTTLNEKFGALPNLTALTAGIMGFTQKGLMTTTAYGPSLNFLTKSDVGILEKLNEELYRTKPEFVEARRQMILTRNEFGMLSGKGKEVGATLDGTTANLKQFSIGAKMGALGMNLLNAAMNAVIVFAVASALRALIDLISDYINRVAIAKQETEDAIQAWKDVTSELASLQDALIPVNERLNELYTLQSTDEWNDTLQKELGTLSAQNATLQVQTDLLKQQEELKRRAARDALQEEIEMATSHKYVSPYAKSDMPFNLGDMIFRMLRGTTDISGKPYISEEEAIVENIKRLKELAELKKANGELTEKEAKEYEEISKGLADVGLNYASWAAKGAGLGISEDTIAQYQEQARIIAEALGGGLGSDASWTIADSLKARFSADRRSQDLSGVAKAWQNKSAADFVGAENQNSEAYKTAQKYAEEYGVSVEYLVAQLQKLGYFTGEANDGLGDAADAYQNVKDAIEDASVYDQVKESFDALTSAVEQYNDQGFVTEDTLTKLNEISPDLVASLLNEAGGFDAAKIAALGSADGVWAAILASANMQLQAATANYDNLVAQYNSVEEAARKAATWQAVSDAYTAAQANVAAIEDIMAAGYGGSSSSSGGGGASSIYSEAYQSAVDLTEHYIEMSEQRQKRYAEESDEYRTQSQAQLSYYQDLISATFNEIERLRAKGYDESNAEFRKLLEDYESYQTEMYQLAYTLWQQQQAAAKKAVQAQIDAENDRWEARKKQLDHEKDYYQSLLTLENAYLETIKEIHSEIAELDKQRAVAMAYPEGSGLALFTQDEHDNLTGQLRAIEDEASAIYQAYQEKLSSVTAETTWELEGVTKEFERQYELLLKQYNVAKDKLAVARAQRDLESAMSQRNVAMLVNGVWQWVADPESVKAAVEAVYDAQQEAEDSLTDLYNTQKTQALEAFLTEIDMQSAAEEAAHEAIINGLQRQLEAIDQMEFVFEDFIAALMGGISALKSVISPVEDLDDEDPVPVIIPPDLRAPGGGRIAIGGGKPNLSSQNYVKYADGGVADFTGPIQIDGSKTRSEVVFNSADAAKLYTLVHDAPNLVGSWLKGALGSPFVKAGVQAQSISQQAPVNDQRHIVYLNGNIMLQGKDAESFISILERATPVYSNS